MKNIDIITDLKDIKETLEGGLVASNIAIQDVSDSFKATNVEDALNELVERVEEIDTTINETLNITVSCSDSSSAIGQVVTVRNTKENTTVDYVYDGNAISVKILAGTEYEVYINDKSGYIRPSVHRYVAGYGAIRNVNFYYEKIVKYGIKVNKNDSNPDTRVEYIYDAVGMRPARMNFETGEFDYGDWKDVWFVKKNRPVMLRYDGTVDYELDRDNQVLKAGGGASDIENEAYNGNAMSEIPLGWIKQWEDADYEYHVVCCIQLDSDFKALPFTNEAGVVKNVAYMSMYESSLIGTKLRSLAGKTCKGGATNTESDTNSKANGAGWGLWYWSMYDYLNMLMKIISKSTDCQSSFGNGVCTGKVVAPTGNTKAKGQFFGTNNTASVKVFYIENIYANMAKYMSGFNHVSEYHPGICGVWVKMTPPYSFSNQTGYTKFTFPENASSVNGSVSRLSVSTNTGSVPIGYRGSTSTYYCDYCSFGFSSKGTCAVLFGGDYYNDSTAGRAGMIAIQGIDNPTLWYAGSGLSFLKAGV